MFREWSWDAVTLKAGKNEAAKPQNGIRVKLVPFLS